MKILNLAKILTFCLILGGYALAQAQISQRDEGIELYRQGEYQKAVEQLQKTVTIDEKDEEAWLYLGMSFARSKEREKAAEAFKKADALRPKKPQPKPGDVKITEKPRPSYTDAARANQVSGVVKLAIEFGADGELKYAFVFRALPHGLTENVFKVVPKIKFEPAVKNGKPVSAVKIIEYSFQIY